MNPLAVVYRTIHGVMHQFPYRKVNEKHLEIMLNCFILIRSIFNKLNNCTVIYSRTPLIRNADYPDRLSPSRKFVENSTKLTCLEIIGYRIKYSTVLRLLELQIGRGRKV
jgi:hypothetical protein